MISTMMRTSPDRTDQGALGRPARGGLRRGRKDVEACGVLAAQPVLADVAVAAAVTDGEAATVAEVLADAAAVPVDAAGGQVPDAGGWVVGVAAGVAAVVPPPLLVPPPVVVPDPVAVPPPVGPEPRFVRLPLPPVLLPPPVVLPEVVPPAAAVLPAPVVPVVEGVGLGDDEARGGQGLQLGDDRLGLGLEAGRERQVARRQVTGLGAGGLARPGGVGDEVRVVSEGGGRLVGRHGRVDDIGQRVPAGGNRGRVDLEQTGAVGGGGVERGRSRCRCSAGCRSHRSGRTGWPRSARRRPGRACR